MRRHRLRKWAKWVCTGVAAACVVLFVVSPFRWAAWNDPSDHWGVGVASAALFVWWETARQSPRPLVTGFHSYPNIAGLRAILLWPRVENSSATHCRIGIPLWMPFLLTAV